MRLLDPADRALMHGLSDLSAPPEEIAILPLHPRIVFISENEQSGLAFGDVPGAVLFFGLGKGVTQLDAVPWIHEGTVIYWGDADTWGLQILASLRRRFPKTRAVMMDEATLVRFHAYAVEEPRQAPEAVFCLLKPRFGTHSSPTNMACAFALSRSASPGPMPGPNS